MCVCVVAVEGTYILVLPTKIRSDHDGKSNNYVRDYVFFFLLISKQAMLWLHNDVQSDKFRGAWIVTHCSG